MSLLLHIIVTYIKENIITKLQKLYSAPRNSRLGNKSPTLFVKKPLCTGDLSLARKIFIERPVTCLFLQGKDLVSERDVYFLCLINMGIPSPKKSDRYCSTKRLSFLKKLKSENKATFIYRWNYKALRISNYITVILIQFDIRLTRRF